METSQAPHILFQHSKNNNNNLHGDIRCYSSLFHFNTSFFRVHGSCGSTLCFFAMDKSGNLSQLPYSLRPLFISDIFPVPLSRPCWKSQPAARLDNTCSFQSEFPANINHCRASLDGRLPSHHIYAARSVRHPSIWGSIFCLSWG